MERSDHRIILEPDATGSLTISLTGTGWRSPQRQNFFENSPGTMTALGSPPKSCGPPRVEPSSFFKNSEERKAPGLHESLAQLRLVLVLQYSDVSPHNTQFMAASHPFWPDMKTVFR